MKIAWSTDPHFNFVDDAGIDRFVADVRIADPDVLLIGGDIGEADSFVGYLRRLADELAMPIHFVLGNHDYYKGSIAEVRVAARELCAKSDRLNWLAESDVVLLSDNTALVGHGGWGDARAADFLGSDVILNDYLLIRELRTLIGFTPRSPEISLNSNLMAKLKSLGDDAAAHLRRVLPVALEQRQHVIVLMHVPPFREACWHQGKPSDDNWAPHFTCIAAGEALVEFAERFPQRTITVLCGHTHSPGYSKLRDNLEIHTGGAVYGEPTLQRVWDEA